MMHEEVNQRVVSLCIRSIKMTSDVLARALSRYISAQMHKPKIKRYATGKQTLKQLMEQNAGATNFELDTGSARDFGRVARKYHLDYAIKKDKTCDPPKFLVFFKARDQEIMTLAFKEFIDNCRKSKEKDRKLPFKETLRRFRELSRSQNKDREHVREKEQTL